MEPTVGFEPTTCCLQNSCSNRWAKSAGAEDRMSTLRVLRTSLAANYVANPTWCQGEGSNLRRHKAACFTDRCVWPLRYPGTPMRFSPIHWAQHTRIYEQLQIANICSVLFYRQVHLTALPPRREKSGAEDGIWTHDPVLTKNVLYHWATSAGWSD